MKKIILGLSALLMSQLTMKAQENLNYQKPSLNWSIMRRPLLFQWMKKRNIWSFRIKIPTRHSMT